MAFCFLSAKTDVWRESASKTTGAGEDCFFRVHYTWSSLTQRYRNAGLRTNFNNFPWVRQRQVTLRGRKSKRRVGGKGWPAAKAMGGSEPRTRERAWFHSASAAKKNDSKNRPALRWQRSCAERNTLTGRSRVALNPRKPLQFAEAFFAVRYESRGGTGRKGSSRNPRVRPKLEGLRLLPLGMTTVNSFADAGDTGDQIAGIVLQDFAQGRRQEQRFQRI